MALERLRERLLQMVMHLLLKIMHYLSLEFALHFHFQQFMLSSYSRFWRFVVHLSSSCFACSCSDQSLRKVLPYSFWILQNPFVHFQTCWCCSHLASWIHSESMFDGLYQKVIVSEHFNLFLVGSISNFVSDSLSGSGWIKILIAFFAWAADLPPVDFHHLDQPGYSLQDLL